MTTDRLPSRSPGAAPARNQSLRGSSHRTLLLATFAVLAAAILAFVLLKPVKVMPVLAQAPSYSLTDQNGQPFDAASLDGKVVVYDFIYTSCTTVCPAMTGQMLRMQRELEAAGQLGSDVELVTITFDPERDTPQRLTEYAAGVGADTTTWHWLTGDTIAIKQLVGGDFGVYFEKVAPEEMAGMEGHEGHDMSGMYDFVHATVFVLVDADGRIRAEYDGMSDVEQVVADAGRVVREQEAGPLTAPIYQLAHLVRAYP